MINLKSLGLSSLRTIYGFFFIRMGSSAAGRLEETDDKFYYLGCMEREHH